MEDEALFKEILNAAFAVHSALGPGLLESAYARCLAVELAERGISAEAEVVLPINYRSRKIESAFRVDLLVEKRIVVELKSVVELTPLHLAQVLTYLKLLNLPSGLLINFNTVRLKDGIRRIFNNFSK
ncbi:MAG: GxxExxY protein [Opitutales bacterium]|nr:GxxExxY protein [Opitutales bacterium]